MKSRWLTDAPTLLFPRAGPERCVIAKATFAALVEEVWFCKKNSNEQLLMDATQVSRFLL